MDVYVQRMNMVRPCEERECDPDDSGVDGVRTAPLRLEAANTSFPSSLCASSYTKALSIRFTLNRVAVTKQTPPAGLFREALNWPFGSLLHG